MPRTVHLLIGHWFLELHRATCCFQHKIAGGVGRNLLCANEGEVNHFGIDARSDNEVVFQLPLIAVVKNVHSRINSAIVNPAKVGNIYPPTLWVIADEVVAFAR